MAYIWRKLKEENAGAMVENVIVLPLVFLVIIFMIISAFLIHDRSTLEAAARRGAIYASHCVSDPNYATLVGQTGELDISQEKDVSSLPFASIGKEIKAYRYLLGGNNVESVVQAEVKKIVGKTRINWIPQEAITVTCDQKNKIIYQDITVTVKATYQLPSWLGWLGLDTEYTIETEATISATDPDEFIRNADLVVDLIAAVDKATGNHLEKAMDKIALMGQKLGEWFP